MRSNGREWRHRLMPESAQFVGFHFQRIARDGAAVRSNPGADRDFRRRGHLTRRAIARASWVMLPLTRTVGTLRTQETSRQSARQITSYPAPADLLDTEGHVVGRR